MSATSHDRPLLGRQEALRRRAIRNGWICILFGLLIPFVALWGVAMGWGLREESPRAGWPIVVAGVAVFVVRLALWLG